MTTFALGVSTWIMMVMDWYYTGVQAWVKGR